MTKTISAQVVAKATADGVLVLVPWKHPLLSDVEDAGEETPRCSSCGLKAGWSVLGYGVDGSVCFDCHKDTNNKIILRLRKLRAA